MFRNRWSFNKQLIETSNIAIKNAVKRSSVAEHLVSIPNCAHNYDKTKYLKVHNMNVCLTIIVINSKNYTT